MREITIEMEADEIELLRTEYGNRTGDDDHLIGESDDVIIKRVLSSVVAKLKNMLECCISCDKYFSGSNCSRIKRCENYVRQKTK